MLRRLLLLMPAAALAGPQFQQPEDDDWRRFQMVWNPFASELNRGVFDAKLWEKVRKAFHAIEGGACKN